MRVSTHALRCASVGTTVVALAFSLALPAAAAADEDTAPEPSRAAAPPASAANDGIEDYAGYQPQTKCSPAAKRGTKKLAAWLQEQYPGTGSSGISRSCSSGGTSEHKEGRAFDWTLDAATKADRAKARDFMKRLFATDPDGNAHALARRMGIMYVLWNDHSWASYRTFGKVDYLSSSCRSRKKCSKTLRHRDHMHISLSRPGAKANTSWYGDPAAYTPGPGGSYETGPPVLDLRKRPYAKITAAAGGAVTTTKYALRAGTTYQLTAAGLYGYGSPKQVADPACVWSTSQGTWVPAPGAGTARRRGSLDLRVNGARLFGNSCRASHTYAARFTPEKTGPLRVSIANRPERSYGSLRLVVSRPGTDVASALPHRPELRPAPTSPEPAKAEHGLLAETVALPATRRAGVRTVGGLEPGADYRVTVAGTVRLGRSVVSDGKCVRVRGAWYPSASIDLRVPDQDHGNLYVGGVPFRGSAPCSTHRHTGTFAADEAGRLRLALWDPLGSSNNRGSLAVTVQRVTPVAEPTAAPAAKPSRGEAWTRHRDFLKVRASKRSGATSEMRLREGERVQIVVRGKHRSNQGAADASCVRTPKGWRVRDKGLALEQDLLDLWVDGTAVRWRAVGERTPCSADHTYVTNHTATKDGPLRLAVLDLDRRDNDGDLEVTLLRG